MPVKITKIEASNQDELYEKTETFLNFRCLEFGQFKLIPSAQNSELGGVYKCYVVHPNVLSDKDEQDKWGLR